MRKVIFRRALALLGFAALAGCASVPAAPGGGSAGALECVAYARLHSPVKLFGDAYLWWDRAAGKYARAARPSTGAVVALNGYAGAQRGHVAVVRSVVSAREIRVDHANWFNDGAIYVDNPVADVSSGNDWSQVRVWNMRTGSWGARVYAVQGFIGPNADAAAMALLAPR